MNDRNIPSSPFRWIAVTGTRRHVLLGGVLALAGCTYSMLPNLQEQTSLYTLGPETSFPDTLPKVKWQLVVNLPAAPAAIDTSRIALSRSPLVLEYYAKASWTDNAPRMVQTLLIESFERTGKVAAVGSESAGLRPDYVLQTDLRECQADYRDGDPIPSVVVRMTARLFAMPQRRVVGSLIAKKSVKASGSHFADVLNAFNDALRQVLKEVVVMTLTSAVPVD